MKRRALLHCTFIACGIAFGGVLARAQEANEKAYSLLRVYQVGAKARYKTVMDVEVKGGAQSGKGQIVVAWRDEVKEIGQDGNAIVEQIFDRYAIKAPNSKPDEMGEFMSKLRIVQTQDVRGRILTMKIVDADGKEMPQGKDDKDVFRESEAAMRPEKPVRIGETWEFAYSGNSNQLRNVAVKGKGKLVGLEKVGETEVLRIEADAEGIAESPAGAKLTFRWTLLVDTATRRPVKMIGSAEGALSQSQQMAMRFELFRLDLAAKPASH